MLDRYEHWLLSAGRGEGTARLYVSRIRQLQCHHLDLFAVTKADLEEYLSVRRASHKGNTRKSMRSAFRSFYGWAFSEGLVDVDPSYMLMPVSVPASLPRVAADEVVQMGLLTADEHLTAMILLARFGCLRLTELTTLHTRQREHDLLRIVGKGEKERLVPINDELMHALLALERLQGPGYYFPGRQQGSMHPASVNKIITRHLGINPHSLRHAGATAAYLATGDLRAVQMLLGHSSMATTQRYLHIGMDAVRRAAAGTSFSATISSFPPTTMPPARGRVEAA